MFFLNNLMVYNKHVLSGCGCIENMRFITCSLYDESAGILYFAPSVRLSDMQSIRQSHIPQFIKVVICGKYINLNKITKI